MKASVPAASIHQCMLLLFSKCLPNMMHHHLAPVFQSLRRILISSPPYSSCMEQKTCHCTSGSNASSCHEARLDMPLLWKLKTILFHFYIEL